MASRDRPEPVPAAAAASFPEGRRPQWSTGLLGVQPRRAAVLRPSRHPSTPGARRPASGADAADRGAGMQRRPLPAGLSCPGDSSVRRFALIAAGALALAAPAFGAWSAGATGSGAAAARTMPAGNTPSGTAAPGSVTVTWTASTFAGGAAVPGYVVRRFNSVTQAEATVLPACAGIVSGTSCIESSVPIGSWKYTVTPAAGTWRGTQSAQSAAVLVTL